MEKRSSNLLVLYYISEGGYSVYDVNRSQSVDVNGVLFTDFSCHRGIACYGCGFLRLAWGGHLDLCHVNKLWKLRWTFLLHFRHFFFDRKTFRYFLVFRVAELPQFPPLVGKWRVVLETSFPITFDQLLGDWWCLNPGLRVYHRLSGHI